MSGALSGQTQGRVQKGRSARTGGAEGRWRRWAPAVQAQGRWAVKVAPWHRERGHTGPRSPGQQWEQGASPGGRTQPEGSSLQHCQTSRKRRGSHGGGGEGGRGPGGVAPPRRGLAGGAGGSSAGRPEIGDRSAMVRAAWAGLRRTLGGWFGGTSEAHAGASWWAGAQSWAAGTPPRGAGAPPAGRGCGWQRPAVPRPLGSWPGPQDPSPGLGLVVIG